MNTINILTRGRKLLQIMQLGLLLSLVKTHLSDVKIATSTLENMRGQEHFRKALEIISAAPHHLFHYNMRFLI